MNGLLQEIVDTAISQAIRELRPLSPAKQNNHLSFKTPARSNKPLFNPTSAKRTQPFKSPMFVKKPTPVKKDNHEKIRKLKFVKSLIESDKNSELESLINEWTRASQEALLFLRDRIGPVQVNQQQRVFGNEWDSVYNPPETSQVRLLSLEEMANRMGIDVELLGDYDRDSDCFN